MKFQSNERARSIPQELPETPEITEMAENFTKIGKILRQKAVRINFFVDFAFSNMLYDKKRKPANAGNQQKAFYFQKVPSVDLLSLLENC